MDRERLLAQSLEWLTLVAIEKQREQARLILGIVQGGAAKWDKADWQKWQQQMIKQLNA